MIDQRSEERIVGIFADMTVSSYPCDECGMSFMELPPFAVTGYDVLKCQGVMEIHQSSLRQKGGAVNNSL